MHSDALHHEESSSTKVGILRLLLFFKDYFIPYKKAVAVTTLLALLVIATELLLPQLMKTALDRFITPATRMITEQPGRSITDLVPAAERRFLLPSDRPGTFFILPEQLRRLGMRKYGAWRRTGYCPEKYYAAPADSRTDSVAAKYPALFPACGFLSSDCHDQPRQA